MPEHRIRVGTWNAADMTSTYDIRNFPLQDDQLNYYLWMPPVSPSGFMRQYDAVITDTLDGTRGGIGRYNGSWLFDPITPMMAQYWRNTYFPTDGWNEVVTIVTYSIYEGWICLNLNAHWNDPALVVQARPGSRTVSGLRIDFDEGVLAASGGSHSLAHNISHNIGGIPA